MAGTQVTKSPKKPDQPGHTGGKCASRSAKQKAARDEKKRVEMLDEEETEENEIQAYIAEYFDRMGKARDGGKALLNEKDKLVLPLFRKDFDRSELKVPLSLRQYRRGVVEGTDMRQAFLIVTAKQARWFLEQGPLRIPLLVPKKFVKEARALVILHQFLDRLATFDKVDFHDYAEKGEAVPKTGTPAEVIDRIKKGDVINLLDIQMDLGNPIQQFLVDIPGWGFLARMKQDDHVGAGQIPGRHVAAALAYQLLATKGAISTEHVDHNAVITTVRMEHGEKIWLEWPDMSVAEFSEWIDTRVLKQAPTMMLIEEGTTLIQPAARVHAVLTTSKVALMTGYTAWDSKDMRRVAEMAFLERSSGYRITNDAQAADLVQKLEFARSLWEERSAAYPWGSEEDLEKFKYYLRKLKPECSCTGLCNNCKCKKANVNCSVRCHGKKKNEKCQRPATEADE